MIFKLLSQETVVKFVRRHSLVLELSDSGAFRRSLHDPDGQVAAYVSEAHEHDGHLYLGSFRAPSSADSASRMRKTLGATGARRCVDTPSCL